MKFPVNSLLAGNLTSETGSLETASSSEESANHRSPPIRPKKTSFSAPDSSILSQSKRGRAVDDPGGEKMATAVKEPGSARASDTRDLKEAKALLDDLG